MEERWAKGKARKAQARDLANNFRAYCNTCGTWGHKAIDCKSQGKGKDGARWHQGNQGKGKGMNNFEHSQRSWQAPPFTPDVLLIVRKTEPDCQGYKKEQLSYVKQNTTTRTNGDPTQGQQEKGTSSESLRSLADGC